MLAQKQLNDLAERRRLLIVEADLHRKIVAMQVQDIRTKFEWLSQARDRVFAGKPWLAAGGVIAGLFAVRHWRKAVRWAPVAMTAIRWVNRLKGR